MSRLHREEVPDQQPERALIDVLPQTAHDTGVLASVPLRSMSGGITAMLALEIYQCLLKRRLADADKIRSLIDAVRMLAPNADREAIDVESEFQQRQILPPNFGEIVRAIYGANWDPCGGDEPEDDVQNEWHRKTLAMANGFGT